jgi:2-isopropylmalate synthase
MTDVVDEAPSTTEPSTTGPKVEIYDTTLRDGSQQVGLDLTVADKLRVAAALDALGVDVIEGGWPGSNPKDAEFFARTGELGLQHAQLAAFGATRLPRRGVDDDPSLAALLAAGTPIVALVGKAWTLHVDEALRTTRDENLAMVADSVAFMAAAGRRVVFDAEHFFDGYRADPGYAVAVLEAAVEAGADTLALCDTNGGMLPDDVTRVLGLVAARVRGPRIGVHFHNDAGCAVANSVVAVAGGAVHVQGAANGYGERCGNADLFAIIAGLELKRGHELLPPGRLGDLASTARTIAEFANLPLPDRQPYVGSSAFATKAGLHASAIARRPDAYAHVDPGAVGNEQRVLVSELAGRSNVLSKAAELGLDLPGELAAEVLDQVKEAEHRGYAYEAADASFELLVRRIAGALPTWFSLDSYRVMIERSATEDRSEAIVRLRLGPQQQGGDRVVAVGEGVGPVHALDQALRRALSGFYPALAGIRLVDYKVRILDGRAATSAVTRVMLTSADQIGEWTTVGVSDDIVTASWEALADGVAYGLLRAGVAAPEPPPDPVLAGSSPAPEPI